MLLPLCVSTSLACSQLEHVTASKESLKEQLAKQGREAASLRAEAADRTRENIELHKVGPLMERRVAE
eukprot:1161829-Pelagomonas_calceolata.AAC.11